MVLAVVVFLSFSDTIVAGALLAGALLASAAFAALFLAAFWAITSAAFRSAKDLFIAVLISDCKLSSELGSNLAGGLLIRPLLVVTSGLPCGVPRSGGGSGPCWGDRPSIQSLTLSCLEVPATGVLFNLEAFANGFCTFGWATGVPAAIGLTIGGSGVLGLGCLILIWIFGKLILISGIGCLLGPSGAIGTPMSWPWSHVRSLACDEVEGSPSSNSGIPASDPSNEFSSLEFSASDPCTEACTLACAGSVSSSELSALSTERSGSEGFLRIKSW